MDLGQIFTRDLVAEYMVSLFTLEDKALILDPCFGEGAFLTALKKTGKYNAFGYEIDKRLFENNKANFKGFILNNEDFLQATPKKKFDGIIMNPPYIRHEKINEMASLGVSKDILFKNSLYSELPSTANMYMFFIVKAISLLKKKGELIVIFPGSWLQARNGDRFETALYRNCSVERQIHISGQVFEKSALVDVIILKLRKDGEKRQAVPEFVRLNCNKLEKYENETKSVVINFNSSFSSISKVRRGLTTGCNNMFINPNISEPGHYLRPIISTPKQLKGYSTNGALVDELIVIDRENLKNPVIKAFVADWENRILREDNPKTFVQKIKEHKEWFRLHLFSCRGIIFSYFVRNDMKFVYNDTDNIIRDNFYILYPKIDKWLCFSLLNNLYTYYQLECVGKKYGKGLLKIQRYDIESLKFPDIKMITLKDILRLKCLGKKLANSGEKMLVEEITTILSRYSNVSNDDINSAYRKIVNNRLENI